MSQQTERGLQGTGQHRKENCQDYSMLIMPLFLCLLALAIVLGMTGLPVLISLKAECIEGKKKCWFLTDYKKAGQLD